MYSSPVAGGICGWVVATHVPGLVVLEGLNVFSDRVGCAGAQLVFPGLLCLPFVRLSDVICSSKLAQRLHSG